MKNNLFTDIKAAVSLFGDMRKARKAGRRIEIRQVAQIPVIKCGPGFYSTVEGCALSQCGEEISDAAQEAFSRLSLEERSRLVFSPKDGEFVERAYLWRELLKSALPPKQCRIAMAQILRWYIHIKQTRAGRNASA